MSKKAVVMALAPSKIGVIPTLNHFRSGQGHVAQVREVEPGTVVWRIRSPRARWQGPAPSLDLALDQAAAACRLARDVAGWREVRS